jgi:hypothetical protein
VSIIKKAALYFARKKFCREAIAEHADLSAIKEKPTMSMIVGLIMIAFSYVIGLPTVVAVGVFAASMNKPLIGVIGGVIIYGISTIMFIVGIKMAGKTYFLAVLRWGARVILEKIIGREALLLSATESENKSSQG